MKNWLKLQKYFRISAFHYMFVLLESCPPPSCSHYLYRPFSFFPTSPTSVQWLICKVHAATASLSGSVVLRISYQLCYCAVFFSCFVLIIIQLVFRGERETGRSCTVCKYKKLFCKWGTGRWGMCFKRVSLITGCIKNHSEKV